MWATQNPEKIQKLSSYRFRQGCKPVPAKTSNITTRHINQSKTKQTITKTTPARVSTEIPAQGSCKVAASFPQGPSKFSAQFQQCSNRVLAGFQQSFSRVPGFQESSRRVPAVFRFSGPCISWHHSPPRLKPNRIAVGNCSLHSDNKTSQSELYVFHWKNQWVCGIIMADFPSQIRFPGGKQKKK